MHESQQRVDRVPMSEGPKKDNASDVFLGDKLVGVTDKVDH